LKNREREWSKDKENETQRGWERGCKRRYIKEEIILTI